MINDSQLVPLNEDSKLLAAATYIPFFFINLISIIYILVKKKDDLYAKYHAIQALTCIAIMLLIILPVELIGLAILLPKLITSFAIHSTFPFTAFFAIWAILLIALIVSFTLTITFAYLAYIGKAFKIPIISKQIKKHM